MSKRSDSLGFFWEDVAAVKEVKEKAPKREAPNPIWRDPNWLPNYEEAAAYKPKLLIMQEFLSLPKGTELLYDVECYPNFFCVTFEDFATGKKIFFELSPWSVLDTTYLKYVWQYHTKTGFNNKKYDDYMIELALAGLNNAALHNATKMLIEKDPITGQAMQGYKVLRHYGVKKTPGVDTMDLIEVAPLTANLKIYGARLHTPHLQDLPVAPGTILTQYQAVLVRYYNGKDILSTRYLRHALAPQIALRYQMSKDYDEDLRSRSDAQIAEAVMRKELSRILGRKIEQPEYPEGTFFTYKDPGFLAFQTSHLQGVFNLAKSTRFYLDEYGRLQMPKELDGLQVTIGGMTYTMGIGGLHSTESKRSLVAGGGYKILDRDVTSYYPYLILNQNLFPDHIGVQFLAVFRGIVETRVAAKASAKKAKKAGDKVGEAYWNGIANALKIVINGAYGKLGSPHSCLYAPALLTQTTLTGQFSLLMLIEAMELAGIRVISANTDGVTMMVHETQMDMYNKVLAWWESATRFETEEVEYLSLNSRDVNNYIAIKAPANGEKASAKTKGAYANPWSNNKEIEPWLHINPTSQIVVTAVEKFLVDHIPVEQTIRNCTQITEFVNVRSVSSGCAIVTRGDLRNRTPSEQIAVVESHGGQQVSPGKWVMPWDDAEQVRTHGNSLAVAYRSCIMPKTVDFLGKAIRWYYATGRENYELVAAKSGNRVGSTDGAMPCMDLPAGLPEDLDYNWYINKANKVLEDIGYA